MKNAPLPNIEARFRAYAEKLSTVLGHADRVAIASTRVFGLWAAAEVTAPQSEAHPGECFESGSGFIE